MRVIGVDPGLRHTGWGVVEFKNNKVFHIADGSISPSIKLDDGKRLLEIKNQLQKIINQLNPNMSVIEKTFIGSGSVSSLKLGMARGASMIALAEAGFIEPIVKVGNLDSLRTIADVRDAVRAYHMAVTINPKPGSYFNIGGNYSTTIRELLDDLIALSTCKDITIEIDPERLRPIDADLQVPDIRKVKNHTGWEPEIPYKKTLEDLLNYWREEIKMKGEFLTR